MKFKPWLAILLVFVSFCIKNAYAADDDVPTATFKHDAINEMLLQSVSLMGIPYRWGGNTPKTGMDCSGFIRYVFKKSLGITLPRTANEMSKVGKRVSIDDLEPGDLLFFNIHHVNSHVGMYIGDNKFIQSPHTGDKIKISEFNSAWRAHFNGAKRIVSEDKDDDGKIVVSDYQYINNERLPNNFHGKYSKHHHSSRKHHHSSKTRTRHNSSKSKSSTVAKKSISRSSKRSYSSHKKAHNHKRHISHSRDDD
jgi:hypothetical protein